MTHRRRRILTLLLSVSGLCAALGASLLTTPAWAIEGSGWQHALRLAQRLRAEPPDASVVVLLGGSCAREATVGDKEWAAEVQSRGGRAVVTYDLASRNQTFEQDVALVKALPKIPMLVFIGVNLGRFTSPPTTTISTTPVATKGTYSQHHYSSARVKTLEQKQKQVRQWLRQRYPFFQERYAANLAQLDRLIAACKQRGYRPVVLDLPRNMEVIGAAFDVPIKQYQDGCRALASQHGCRALASQHGVPFVDFVADAQLKNEDFYDLNHLVDPGRPKYQARLADETVRLLSLDGARATTAAASAEALQPSEAGARYRVLWPFGVTAVLMVGALAVQRRRVVVRRRRRARRRRVAAHREAAIHVYRSSALEDDADRDSSPG